MRDGGFSLVEVVVATAVVMVATVALAQVSLAGLKSNRDARLITLATVLASRKAEQLRALAWAYDGFGGEVSDSSTNTASVPELSSGGTGLTSSPARALFQNSDGYCDFVDAAGRLIEGGTIPPAGAAFVRRWSIARLPGVGVDTLVIQVSVTQTSARGEPGPAPARGEARLSFVKTRKGI